MIKAVAFADGKIRSLEEFVGKEELTGFRRGYSKAHQLYEEPCDGTVAWMYRVATGVLTLEDVDREERVHPKNPYPCKELLVEIRRLLT